MRKNKSQKVQVYLDEDVVALLINIADRSGVSLASLIRDSVVENLLGTKGQIHRLNEMDKKLSFILARLEDLQNRPQIALEPTPQRKRPISPTMLSHSSTPLIDSNKTISIDDLLKRFNAKPAVRATLYIVGGSDGKVFEGDLIKARTIEKCTIKHDPENLPWLPVDKQRRHWIQMSAQNWVIQILNKSADPT